MTRYGHTFDETHIHPAISAQSGSDIVTTTEVQRIFPFDWECKKPKNKTSATCEAAWRQSNKRTPLHLSSLVVMEHNNRKPMVFGRLNDLASWNGSVEQMTEKITIKNSLIIQRGKSNPKSLYEIWWEQCYKGPHTYILSYNPLIKGFENRLFLQMDFEKWLDLWYSLYVKYGPAS